MTASTSLLSLTVDRTHTRWHRAIRIGLACLALSTCTALARADIVVAVGGPSTGRTAPITVATLDGARKAAAVINAKGGVIGEQLTIETADDSCDGAKATASATTLAAKKVALVIGHPCTAAARAAAKVYADKSILFFATASRHPSLTSPRIGPTIFRLAGRDDQQGEDAGHYLAGHFKGKTIAIVHDRTRYARTIAEAAANTFMKSGAGVPITATLIASEKDFPLVTAKIKDASAIFYAGYPLESGLLHAQLRAAGSKAIFLMSDANATPEFAATFGASAEGVFVMRPRFALQTDTSESSSQQASLNAASRLAEAAVQLFAAAATGTASTDAAKIAAALNGRDHQIASSPIGFEINGDAKRPSFDVSVWTGSIWTAPPDAILPK